MFALVVFADESISLHAAPDPFKSYSRLHKTPISIVTDAMWRNQDAVALDGMQFLSADNPSSHDIEPIVSMRALLHLHGIQTRTDRIWRMFAPVEKTWRKPGASSKSITRSDGVRTNFTINGVVPLVCRYAEFRQTSVCGAS